MPSQNFAGRKSSICLLPIFVMWSTAHTKVTFKKSSFLLCTQNSQLREFLMKWLDFVLENLQNNSKYEWRNRLKFISNKSNMSFDRQESSFLQYSNKNSSFLRVRESGKWPCKTKLWLFSWTFQMDKHSKWTPGKNAAKNLHAADSSYSLQT